MANLNKTAAQINTILGAVKVDDALTNAVLGTTNLASNTTGHNLVGVGYGVLLLNATGYDNVAIGSLALRNNITGSGLVAIGNQALYRNSTAYYNVAVGDACLKETTGNRNTAIGSYSGYSNTSGEDNIFIGNRAGYNRTISSNLLIIDNQDRGSILNEDSGCLIIGEFNSTSANQKLRINAKVAIGYEVDANYALKINGTLRASTIEGATRVVVANNNWGLELSTNHLLINGYDGIKFRGSNGGINFGQFDSATNKLTLNGDVVTPNYPTYADNAAAIAAGKIIGTHYKTITGELRIVV
jgi:hypothetical protein